MKKYRIDKKKRILIFMSIIKINKVTKLKQIVFNFFFRKSNNVNK